MTSTPSAASTGGFDSGFYSGPPEASAVAPTDSVFSTTFLAIRWVIARFAAFGAEIWLQILARRQRICATQVRDSAAVIIPSIDSIDEIGRHGYQLDCNP